MNKHKKKDAKTIFSKVLLELPYVFLTSHSGFTYRLVKFENMQISSLKTVNI